MSNGTEEKFRVSRRYENSICPRQTRWTDPDDRRTAGQRANRKVRVGKTRARHALGVAS